MLSKRMKMKTWVLAAAVAIAGANLTFAAPGAVPPALPREMQANKIYPALATAER